METEQIIEKINEDYKDREKIRDKSILDETFGDPDDYIQIIEDYENKVDLAKKFIELYPLYYDKAGLWWGWNKKLNCYNLIDEVDILNLIKKSSRVGVIQSRQRTEILNALKQTARENEPEQPEKSWIQFGKEVIDIETGERFLAKPKYFFTNPIPFKLGKCEDTPTIDKIFEQWVGKDYIKTLKQIIAYCLVRDYPIHRLFCLIGAGRNGKGCFERLIEKFLGKMNCCSTELDLLIRSRFEVAKLYKKLVCLMGEANFNELTQTSIIKKLTGQDTIGFEFKNKTPFDDYNYSKIIIATNNLPSTTDKTLGFYSRWLIIDFPNQFSEEQDILSTIPEIEYENLALQCVGVLIDLLKNRKFDNQGTYEERIKRYEDRSNPLEKFWKDSVIEDGSNFIFKHEFRKRISDWLKENRFRELSDKSIAHFMNEKGINSSQKYADWYTSDGKKPFLRTWEGIRWKEN